MAPIPIDCAVARDIAVIVGDGGGRGELIAPSARLASWSANGAPKRRLAAMVDLRILGQRHHAIALVVIANTTPASLAEAGAVALVEPMIVPSTL
jgi:hypothetical protein